MSDKGIIWDLVEPKVSYGWLLALAFEHGWKADFNMVKAVAVCAAESSRYSRAWHINDPGGPKESLDQGLFQINDRAHPYDGNIWNPWENVAEARRIFVGRGYKFNAWAAYNSGAYLKYVPLVWMHYARGRWQNKLPLVTNWDRPLTEAPPIPTPEEA